VGYSRLATELGVCRFIGRGEAFTRLGKRFAFVIGHRIYSAVISLLVLSVVLVACAVSPTRIVVQWETASEINTAGFNLYRSERAEGPYTKVNVQIIPASTDPVLGGKYVYEDTNVVPGRTYYYQLEDVEFSGTTARHGPLTITAPAPFGIGDAPALIAVGAGALVVLGAAFYAVRRRAKR
jgi:hypothetical protein